MINMGRFYSVTRLTSQVFVTRKKCVPFSLLIALFLKNQFDVEA